MPRKSGLGSATDPVWPRLLLLRLAPVPRFCPVPHGLQGSASEAVRPCSDPSAPTSHSPTAAEHLRGPRTVLRRTVPGLSARTPLGTKIRESDFSSRRQLALPQANDCHPVHATHQPSRPETCTQPRTVLLLTRQRARATHKSARVAIAA